MTVVNMHDAKTRLSKLVVAIRSGEEREVIIAINGTPAARLVTVEPKPRIKWRLLKGKITVPDDIDELNPEIEAMFAGRSE